MDLNSFPCCRVLFLRNAILSRYFEIESLTKSSLKLSEDIFKNILDSLEEL
jgi:hypothetical protein